LHFSAINPVKWARCTKSKKRLKKVEKLFGEWEKVIHIGKARKIEKNELYTKLSTLSTEKKDKKLVYIVKRPNIRFVKI